MNQVDKQTIHENLNKLLLLKSLLPEDWINKNLEKNKPSTLILLTKYKEPRLQHLENNLNYIGLDDINQHKKYILEYLKGGVAQVYGIISEIDVWAHLKKNSIFCTYQSNIDGFDKQPDFLIKLNQDEIIVEVATLNEGWVEMYFLKIKNTGCTIIEREKISLTIKVYDGNNIIYSKEKDKEGFSYFYSGDNEGFIVTTINGNRKIYPQDDDTIRTPFNLKTTGGTFGWEYFKFNKVGNYPVKFDIYYNDKLIAQAEDVINIL